MITAVLHTDHYTVYDFEKVDSVDVERGQKFKIVVSDLPEGSDWFSNSDPSLSVRVLMTPEGKEFPQGVVEITSDTDGVSRLQLRDANDALLKEWRIKVYSNEAVSMTLSSEVEPRS